MIDAFVVQLKTGTVKNVVAYPDKSPTKPYLVVKAESRPELGRTDYRVFVHGDQSQKLWIRKYAKADVYNLLADRRLTSAYFGCTNLVRSSDYFSETPVLNDDGTIAMERLFYVMDLF